VDLRVAPLLERIVVIGASVSDGFLIDEFAGGPRTAQYRFGRYLDAALAAPHGEIITHANRMFFVGPATVGETQVDAALKEKPSLVVGIDYLFWFCYGRMPEEARLEMLDGGLEMLARIEAPLVIGDIPDAAAAAGGVLSRSQVPKPETIAKANERLRAWAAARKNVAVVPLAHFMKCCQADEALKVRGIEWPAGKSRVLLQRDRLHPARHGCAALALATVDCLVQSGKLTDDKAVLWDAEQIYEKAVAAAVAEAAKKPEAAPQPGTLPPAAPAAEEREGAKGS
jgi:hypothetical protein